MNHDGFSSPGSKLDPAGLAQLEAPLSITTSRPHAADGAHDSQLPGGNTAQPLSPRPRSISESFPLLSPSQHDTPTRASTNSYDDKSSRFIGGGREADDYPSSRSEARRKAKRRHSHMNVYTECGRHSDDWLFGGFSVLGMVKKLWHKIKKDGKGKTGKLD